MTFEMNIRQMTHVLASGIVVTEPVITAANGLLNNLVAYWPGDEASGNLIDAHTNALNMNDINSVTNNPGIVYPLARQYTAAADEYHTRPGDDALLSCSGNIDMTIATWVYFDNRATTRAIAAKWRSDTTANNEYQLQFRSSTSRLQWVVVSGAGAGTTLVASTFGSPPTSTWICIICWHDSVAGTVNIQVDSGAVDSAGHANGINDNTAAFRIGGRQGPNLSPWDGRIGPTAFWKSAAGGGGVLTADQRTALWNGGAGVQYTSLTV